IAYVPPPVITTGGGSLTLGCNPSSGDINGALGTATATDNCSETGGGPLPGCVASYRGNNGGGNCPNLGNLPPTGTITLFFTTSVTVAPTVLSVTSSDPTDNLSDVLFGPGMLSNDGLSAEYCYYVGPNNNHNLFGANVVLTFNLQFANGQGCVQQAPGALTPTVSDGAVISNGCSRSQTRTFTATDACGNTATASRTATWTADITPPTLTTGGASLTLGCNPSAGDINGALGTASATDACGNPTVTSSDGTVTSDGCSRSQTRTWTARDACGNTSTASRTATWTADVTAPTLTTGGGSLTLGCNPSAGDINGALGTASATDACSTPTVTSSDGSVQSNGCSRSQTRTWTARDACGNTSTASRTATWTADVTAPTLTTGGSSLTLGCNPSAGDINGALGTASATDACGNPTVTSSDGSVTSDGCSRSQTRTFRAIDACGNTSTASRTAPWTADVTAPTLTTGGGSLTLGCNPSAGDINGALGTASATDACGNPT